jgi:predicted nucleotidyltransferase
MPILPNEKKALNGLKLELNKRYDLSDIKIYGSKARGLDTLESDLDVMVVLKKSSPSIESEIDDLIFEINLENDCLITALFFDQKELEEGPLSESPIYKKILQEGISL